MPPPKYDDLPLRLVDISMPLRDKHGNFLGVIAGHLSLDWAFEVGWVSSAGHEQGATSYFSLRLTSAHAA